MIFNMNVYNKIALKLIAGLIVISFVISPLDAFSQVELKFDNKKVKMGEILNYKATWGFITIGSATTRIDKVLHKVGPAVCYKVDVSGQTNGLARLFYVRDKWTSYIDTASITTHKSSRSIREGRYMLDEQVDFDHVNKKAAVRVYDKGSHSYVLKKVYDTPENIRDVIAGFLVFRLIDWGEYKPGQSTEINGFYENEGYRINVTFLGQEYIKTEFGRILCYKVRPVVPRNEVFDGSDSIVIWFTADDLQTIMRIRAKMFVANIQIDLQK